jgi:hypothetical protein
MVDEPMGPRDGSMMIIDLGRDTILSGPARWLARHSYTFPDGGRSWQVGGKGKLTLGP